MATFRRRGGTLNEVSHRNLQTMMRSEQTPKAKPWYVKLDKSKIPVYTDTLSARLKREKIDINMLRKRFPFNIDSTLFRTSDDYSFNHMPKMEDVYYKRLNFSFGETKAIDPREDNKRRNLANLLLTIQQNKATKQTTPTAIISLSYKCGLMFT